MNVLQRRIKEIAKELQVAIAERDGHLRRAMAAEQDAAEWKRRFDTLIEVMARSRSAVYEFAEWTTKTKETR